MLLLCHQKLFLYLGYNCDSVCLTQYISSSSKSNMKMLLYTSENKATQALSTFSPNMTELTPLLSTTVIIALIVLIAKGFTSPLGFWLSIFLPLSEVCSASSGRKYTDFQSLK